MTLKNKDTNLYVNRSKNQLNQWLSEQFIQKGDSFYVVDIGKVQKQLEQWKKLLPQIKPFYAVKCNPDPIIIQKLYEWGAGFDCASQGEIELVQTLKGKFLLG